MNYILKPSIDLYPGIRVDKDTKLEYKTENVEQTIENFKFRSVTKVKGDGFEGVYDTTVELKEGDILIFEEGGRGYIKPVEPMATIDEAIEELKCLKGVGE